MASTKSNVIDWQSIKEVSRRASTRQNKTREFFDLISYIYRLRDFSLPTFGPGMSTERLLASINKEVTEVRGNPGSLKEWVDIAMLALDGAYRAGFTPEQIARQFEDKLTLNKKREWPGWRAAAGSKPGSHIHPTDNLAAKDSQ